MGVKNSALLEDGQYKDLHTGIDAETGAVADVADASLEAFWHDGQPADLSKGLSLTTVQRFFDYIPRRVFLPWLRALTTKANTDGGRIKTLESDQKYGVGAMRDILYCTEDLKANYIPFMSLFLWIGRQRGVEDPAAEKYLIIDKATSALYRCSTTDLGEYGIEKTTLIPLISFKASNEYSAESESAMSGIAVEAALAELRESIPDLVLEKFPNLDEVSY